MIKLLLAIVIVHGAALSATGALSAAGVLSAAGRAPFSAHGASPAQGQWPAFGVYHTAGAIKCVSTRGGSTVVHPRSWVYDGDKLLLLDAGAEIILFDKDSNYIRLAGKGTYTTDDIKKMQRTHVKDNITVRYLSLLWEELFKPGSAAAMEKETMSNSTGGVSRGLSLVVAPADNYQTSMDGQTFRWQRVAWATTYHLRLRGADGQPRYDSITADTQLYVRFTNRLPYGSSYTWSLDLLGGSGRTQSGATGHLTLVDEKTTLASLPPLPPDPLGDLDLDLQRAEQYENSGCINKANTLYHHLLAVYPNDSSLKELYFAFRRRNYL
jgi:hypothetical protein